MGVTWEQNSFVVCDTEGCGAEQEYHDFSKRDAIWDARAQGWSIGKTVKCPRCKAKGE